LYDNKSLLAYLLARRKQLESAVKYAEQRAAEYEKTLKEQLESSAEIKAVSFADMDLLCLVLLFHK
jgi:hypothetical protein